MRYDGVGVLLLVLDPHGIGEFPWNVGEQFFNMDGDSMTNQRWCENGLWPEANVGQQYIDRDRIAYYA